MHFTETGESKKGWSLLFRKGMMESLKANANLFVNDNNDNNNNNNNNNNKNNNR